MADHPSNSKEEVVGVALRACPFCDGDAKIITETNDPWAVVKCQTCGAESNLITTSPRQRENIAEAIAAWNRRAEGRDEV